MHVYMMYVSMMHVYVMYVSMIPWCICYPKSWCMYDAYMYDADIYNPWSWHMCVWCTMYDALMHISTYLDPKPWCMNVWCIYLLPWSLTLKYVCMMHCIYLVCLFHGLRFLSYKFLEWTLFVLWPVMICKKCYDQWLWLYEHQWSYMIAMNTNHLWSVS